jgi:hypothetical protein
VTLGHANDPAGGDVGQDSIEQAEAEGEQLAAPKLLCRIVRSDEDRRLGRDSWSERWWLSNPAPVDPVILTAVGRLRVMRP